MSSGQDQNSVTENDLRGLFKELVNDLSTQIKAGTATGKDKELALKLIDGFNVGITLEDAQPLIELGDSLPFNEMRPQ